MKELRPIPTLSLFSGAGGLDLGFAQAGFDIRACVEIEPAYAKTLKKNADGGHGFKSDTQIFCQDIREFDVEPFVDVGIECVIGGPPCQTFSAAGRRSGGVIGVDDARGQLFRSYCRILERVQPKVFVFENVYGLPGANGGGPWKEIVTAFADLGYELRAEVVDTADYGVPQHRERLIMVGSKVGNFVFPTPTHGPDSNEKSPLVSVEQAIADLQDIEEPYHNGLGGMYGHLLPEVPEGLNYAYFTAEMGHPEPVFAWRSKFHDLLYKVKRDEPCRTIKAQPGKFTGPFHWKNRHFSVAELKRLQTFPDNYEIVGGYGKVVEQIGNSVPPRVANVIATSVREQLLENLKRLTYSCRPLEFQSTFRQRQRERSAKFKTIAKLANAGRAVRPLAARSGKRSIEKFSYNPANLFDRTRLARGAKVKFDQPIYDVVSIEDGSHIELQVTKQNAVSGKTSSVSITGLAKYLPGWDTCTVLAEVDDLRDVFAVWNVVEDALIVRSRFFTLIDIYGHYANKGDAVDITGEWRLIETSAVNALLNKFASTSACGEFVDCEQLSSEIGVDTIHLHNAISELRAFRFDVRTSLTHPIIGEGRMLCTYPFPLLSPRALVESRVKFVREVEQTSEGPVFAIG